MSGALQAPDGGTVLVPPAQSPSFPEPTEFPCAFGGYTLLRRLGRGGMGAVYEAEQVATGRRVALKMLGQELDSPDMRERFLREGRFAAGINHPNSLYVFGTEEIGSRPVITMEIAGSGTLDDTLKRRGPIPVSEAVDAILNVIAGLEAASAGGVLHRDVKPSNCFVSPDGSVKVGDYGLSVSTLSTADTFATATGVILGTPAYASPEQLRGDDLDVRADIYSVGATLFTLLTGQAPFEGKNAVQVVTNVVNQKPKSVSALREGVPPGLKRVVARCLAKEPEERYGDYMALRNALVRFSSKEPEGASMQVRVPAAWVDYLIAFLIPYVTLMLVVGGEDLLIRPVVERTLYSARYYVALFPFGFLYFGIVEGIWGAGLGKRLKGLVVVRTDGRPPGVARALTRILIPILCIEGVRVPLLMALISATRINDLTTPDTVLFFVATFSCPWIPIVLALRARHEKWVCHRLGSRQRNEGGREAEGHGATVNRTCSSAGGSPRGCGFPRALQNHKRDGSGRMDRRHRSRAAPPRLVATANVLRTFTCSSKSRPVRPFTLVADGGDGRRHLGCLRGASGSAILQSGRGRQTCGLGNAAPLAPRPGIGTMGCGRGSHAARRTEPRPCLGHRAGPRRPA